MRKGWRLDHVYMADKRRREQERSQRRIQTMEVDIQMMKVDLDRLLSNSEMDGLGSERY